MLPLRVQTGGGCALSAGRWWDDAPPGALTALPDALQIAARGVAPGRIQKISGHGAQIGAPCRERPPELLAKPPACSRDQNVHMAIARVIFAAMKNAEGKDELRARARAARKSIGQEKRERDAVALAKRLATLPAVKHASCIGVYNACGSELSLNPAIALLLKMNPALAIAYPLVVSDSDMLYVKFGEGDDRRVLENPKTRVTKIDAKRVVSPEELDIALVPGIAFTEKGERLGQGGGYYDRLLPHLSGAAVTIGVAFNEQIVGSLPTEPHDARVNYLITPTRLINC